MIVVTTPTGHIGSQVLACLVAAGEPVRVVARNRTRINPALLDQIEVVEGSSDDPATIGPALEGAEAVFWCVPPNTQVADVKEYYRNFTQPFVKAMLGSSVRRVVFVSSSGQEAAQDGLIAAAHETEKLLEATGVNFRALRCGMFMEGMLYQIEPLRGQGMFFNPLDGDIPVPLCATRDIAARAADLLRDRSWTGQAGAAVHGPADLSFHEMAGVMTRVLGRPIRYQDVPPLAYKAMLIEHGQSEGFAQGYIDMFREIGAGIHTADPRTPESTTPTTFESWCAATLKPALS